MIFLIFDFIKLSKNRKIFSKNSITRHYKKSKHYEKNRILLENIIFEKVF